jgi:hypothetical protein
MVTPTFADYVELLFTLFERFWQHEAARSHRGRPFVSQHKPTVCPSVVSRNLLLYQSLPIIIPFRYALLRRRKDDTGVGTAARGIVE